MTDNQFADVLDDDQSVEFPDGQGQESGPKALREALKKKAQREKELEAELEQLRAKQRESEIKQKLASAGLPEKAMKFVAKAEDIDAAIEEFKELFGGGGGNAASTQDAEVDDNGAPSGTPSLSEDQIAEIRNLQQISSPGRASSSIPQGQLASQLAEAHRSATSLDDFIEKLTSIRVNG